VFISGKFLFSDHPMSAITAITRSMPPPPPIPIPIWRGFQPGHPNPSQIGVEFNDLSRIGVRFVIWGKVWVSDHPMSAISAITRSFYGPLPVSFSQTPTPHRRFVANTTQTSIRSSGDRAVEVHFLVYFAFEFG
jgi:hypothetical protein